MEHLGYRMGGRTTDVRKRSEVNSRVPPIQEERDKPTCKTKNDVRRDRMTVPRDPSG